MKAFVGEIQTLKRMLMESDDFLTTVNYFFDNLAEAQEFTKMGEPASSPILESVVKAAAAEVFDSRVCVSDLFLINLDEHGFIHGPCIVNGCTGNIFYYKDIQQGMMTVITGPQQGVTFLRLTNTMVQKSWKNPLVFVHLPLETATD